MFSLARLAPLSTMLRLLAHGASIDVRNSLGQTPLMLACSNYQNNGDVALELLRKVVDRDASSD